MTPEENIGNEVLNERALKEFDLKPGDTRQDKHYGSDTTAKIVGFSTEGDDLFVEAKYEDGTEDTFSTPAELWRQS